MNLADFVIAIGLGLAVASGGFAVVNYRQSRALRNAEEALRKRMKLGAGDTIQLFVQFNQGQEQRVALHAIRNVPAPILDEAINLVIGRGSSQLVRDALGLSEPEARRQEIVKAVSDLSEGALELSWVEGPSGGEPTAEASYPD